MGNTIEGNVHAGEEKGVAVEALEVAGLDVALVGGVRAALPALEHRLAGALREHLQEQQPHVSPNLTDPKAEERRDGD